MKGMIGLIMMLFCRCVAGAPHAVQVKLNWNYKNFENRIELFEVTPEKAKFISETAIVSDRSKAPIGKMIGERVTMSSSSSYPLVMLIENKSDKDIYFFAVPHEVHPSHASAGHFFECLCIGRLYLIPKRSTWYRIVRINLNSGFQRVDEFSIEHQIIGVNEIEAKSTYAEKLYNYQ